MFGMFKKDPLKKLQARYEQKLQEAMEAQRNGDIKSYSFLTEEAQVILKAVDELKEKR